MSYTTDKLSHPPTNVHSSEWLVTKFNGTSILLTISTKVPHDLCPLSICSISLPRSLHLNPVSGAGLEEGQSVGGVIVGRLGDTDGAILGGVGHSEGVALGVAGWPGDTQSGGCTARQGQGRDRHFDSWDYKHNYLEGEEQAALKIKCEFE